MARRRELSHSATTTMRNALLHHQAAQWLPIYVIMCKCECECECICFFDAFKLCMRDERYVMHMSHLEHVFILYHLNRSKLDAFKCVQNSRNTNKCINPQIYCSGTFTTYTMHCHILTTSFVIVSVVLVGGGASVSSAVLVHKVLHILCRHQWDILTNESKILFHIYNLCPDNLKHFALDTWTGNNQYPGHLPEPHFSLRYHTSAL